jgi:hypothetical protein
MQLFVMNADKHQTKNPDSQAECDQSNFEFQASGRRKVEISFDGGNLGSEGGAVLLREEAELMRLSERQAECFEDLRNPVFVEHEVGELMMQRVMGLALGYEDLNDHQELRKDAVMSLACGKKEGEACGSAATLNRVEVSSHRSGKYHKVHVQPEKMEGLLLKVGVESLRRNRCELVTDFDASRVVRPAALRNAAHKIFHSIRSVFFSCPMSRLAPGRTCRTRGFQTRASFRFRRFSAGSITLT